MGDAQEQTNDTDGRLSIKRCRMILGKEAPESDDEVRAIRDHLYTLSATVLDSLGDSEPWD